MPNAPSARTLAKQQKADARAGQIAATAQDWDAIFQERCDLETAARRMNVSEGDATYYLFLAYERAEAIRQTNNAARRKPSLSEALLIWGTGGIIRVKSRVQPPRELRIPQFMA